MIFFHHAPQIAVLRGENAVAKTLQSAVHTLERDKAQLQGRVHSLEQRLMGTQASEGDDAGALPSGERRAVGERSVVYLSFQNGFLLNVWLCDASPPVGEAALEQLREEKEFAEGQVRMSD